MCGGQSGGGEDRVLSPGESERTLEVRQSGRQSPAHDSQALSGRQRRESSSGAVSTTTTTTTVSEVDLQEDQTSLG